MPHGDDNVDVELGPAVLRWIEVEAAEHYGGDTAATVAAILTAAFAQSLTPDDPWSALRVRQQARSLPRHRVPVADLVAWIDAYVPAVDGDAATDVLTALGRACGVTAHPTPGTD